MNNNNNSSSSYYNNTAGFAPQPPGRQQSPAPSVSPLCTPPKLQPSPQIDPRGTRQKRQYPRFQQQGSPAPAPAVPGYHPQQFSPQQQFQQPSLPQQQQFQQPTQQFQQPQQQFQHFQQPQQFQQQQPQVQAPINRYASPVPTQTSPYHGSGMNGSGGYNQSLNGMADMNLNNQPIRQDISLVGQPASIQDLHIEAPKAHIPPQVSNAAPFVCVCFCFLKEKVK